MNRLKNEESVYLRSHAAQAVDWWPWCDEALDHAKASDKPILISSGYSSCHWCHVMSHENFEDALTAEMMNDFFINIKIDREERPDLDRYFMEVTQALGQQGGWPLHCFLTPDLEPFFSGTYFPPQPMHGRPSWKQILLGIHNAYKHNKADLSKNIDHIRLYFETSRSNITKERRYALQADFQEALVKLNEWTDWEYGGFGNGQKFPGVLPAGLLIEGFFVAGAESFLNAAILLGTQLCRSAIYDQVDGGFFRYTVDRKWTIPHFEKMLYDQALNIHFLSDLSTLTQSKEFKAIALDAFSFITRTMKGENGLYFASIDADTNAIEGLSYIWTLKELEEILSADEKLVFEQTYILHSFEGDYLTLSAKEAADTKNLSSGLRQKLSAYRAMRPQAAIDRKQILSWNAILLRAFSRLYRCTGNEEVLTQLEALGYRILKHFKSQGEKPDKSIYTRIISSNPDKHPAFLEDYAALMEAMVEWYQIQAKPEILDEIKAISDFVEQNFKKQNGQYAFSANLDPRMKEIPQLEDSSLPNPQVSLRNALWTLHHITGDRKWLESIDPILDYDLSKAYASPYAMATYLMWVEKNKSGGIQLHYNPADQAKLFPLPAYLWNSLLIEDKGIRASELMVCKNLSCEMITFTISELNQCFSNYHIGRDTF